MCVQRLKNIRAHVRVIDDFILICTYCEGKNYELCSFKYSNCTGTERNDVLKTKFEFLNIQTIRRVSISYGTQSVICY